MRIKCPYDQLTLKIATLSAGPKIEKYIEVHGEDAFVKKLEDMCPGVNDMAAFNQKVAEFHGITLDSLINSPNMVTLKDEFRSNMFGKVIEFFQSDVGLTEKEGWAIAAFSMLED